MKKIKELGYEVKYSEGIFNDSSQRKIAELLNVLIEKSNEQTKVINKLIEQRTAKPVFIVSFPEFYTVSEMTAIMEGVAKILHDYHVLAMSTNSDQIEFDCYNVSDAQLKDLDQLKETIGRK